MDDIRSASCYGSVFWVVEERGEDCLAGDYAGAKADWPGGVRTNMDVMLNYSYKSSLFI